MTPPPPRREGCDCPADPGLYCRGACHGYEKLCSLVREGHEPTARHVRDTATPHDPCAPRAVASPAPAAAPAAGAGQTPAASPKAPCDPCQAPRRHPRLAELLSAARSCPDRGPVLPVSDQPRCGCAELTECRAGRGRPRPSGLRGVTLDDCLRCRCRALVPQAAGSA